MPKIKNIIIFLVILIIFVLIYIFFIRSSENEANLISSPPASVVLSTIDSSNNPSVAQDFLSLLLNVKNIKLDDSIFSDNAFNNLRDSSITLIPEGNEGRPNPFAPFGNDIIIQPENVSNTNAGTSTTP